MLQKIQFNQTPLQLTQVDDVTETSRLRMLPSAKRLAVKTTESVHLIRIAEITRCLADNNYTSIYYGHGLKVMVAKTLKSVGEVLPASLFMRVHNSHIVRLDTIHLVYADHIVLYNGDVIPLSRNNKRDLVTQLANTAISL